MIQETFRNQLNSAGYDHTLAKREWEKTKRVITESYLHLAKDSPCLMWSRYIENCKLITPNVCMLLEILVIFLFSSTAVERGISTLNRNVTSQRTSMSNKMLNNILIIKVNAPELAKDHGDIEREIVKRAVHKYFTAKKWRWTIKQNTTDVLNISSTQADDEDLIEEEDIWESDDDEELDRIVNPKLHDEDDNDVELKETEKIV